MIVTVTPNAAIDHTAFVAGLKPSVRHLAVAERRQAGGKGVNVARIATALGAPARAVVVVGGATGMEISRDLETAGLRPVIVRSHGESRTCVEIVDEGSGETTQVHGGGVCADEDTAHALVEAVRGCLPGASWLALCGSLPRGMPLDIYARLIRLGHRCGVRVAVDASGDPLVHAVREGPWLVRINREEASFLRGDIARVENCPFGPSRVCIVSDGPREIAVHANDGRQWRIAPPPVELRNPIGCGDAMLAAFLTNLASLGLEDALTFAIAVAGANAETRFVGGIDDERVRALAALVVRRRVDPGK